MSTEPYAVVLNGAIIETRYLSEPPNVDQTKLAAHKPRLLKLVETRDPINPDRQTYDAPVTTVEAKRVVRHYPAKSIPVADRKSAMLAHLAAKRWAVETGGISLGQITVPTDRDTQSIVDRAVKAFGDGDITGAIDFKTPEGFVQIDEATMRAIKATGAQHIQACFSREAALAAAINAASSHAGLDAIDIDAGWEFGA